MRERGVRMRGWKEEGKGGCWPCCSMDMLVATCVCTIFDRIVDWCINDEQQ